MEKCKCCTLLRKDFTDFKTYVEKHITERGLDMSYGIRYSKELGLLWHNNERHQLTDSATCMLIKFFLENPSAIHKKSDITRFLIKSKINYRSIADLIGRIKNNEKLSFIHKHIVVTGSGNNATYRCNLRKETI